MIEKHIFSFYYNYLIQHEIKIKHTEQIYFRLYSVLKAKINDNFIFFNEYIVAIFKVTSINNKEIIINKIKEIPPIKQEKKIIVYVPLIHKNYVNELSYYIGQRGISKLIFIKTDLSEKNYYSEKDLGKFKKLIIQGCEEGKQYNIPQIDFTDKSLDDILNQKIDLYWFYEHGNCLKSTIMKMQEKIIYQFVCGPEAGFSDREIELLKFFCSGKSIKLNNFILRSVDVINFATTFFSSL